MRKLWETADVARELKVVPATVRALARAGKLRVVASTPRGVRLFKPEDVERLRSARAAKRERGEK